MARDERTAITSIADIARIAGVSVSTVSRALTGKGTLNARTRQMVRDVAEAHGFRMNIAAQNLRLGRTGAIAVLLPLGHEKGQHLSDPFFMAMLGFLADNISERGYALLLVRVIPTQDDWLRAITESGRVDGVVIIGQSDQSAVLDAMALRYAPMVVWGAWTAEQQHLTVGTDNIAGGRLAAEHLMARGRKRLAFFGNPDVPEFGARYDGFLSALTPELRADHILNPVHITADNSYDMTRDYLARNPAPDGIFAASDVVAMSVIRAAVDNGQSVPEDISVIGFDDIAIAAHANPPITTIRQDLEQGASLLCDILFRRMAGEECQSVQLPPQLIVRGSS